MITGALVAYFLRQKKFQFLLEAPLLILAGVCGGAFLKVFGFQSDLDVMCGSFPYIFFLILFPPIMFHASFAMNKVLPSY